MREPIPLSQANRLLNAGCVALVTASARGRSNVMPASWVMPVSQKPPLVAVAIGQESFTHELIARSDEFVLNIPGAAMAKQVLALGMVSGRDEDKLKRVGLRTEPPKVVSTPLIAECLGHLECMVVNAMTTGDHTVFVGEVVMAWAEKEAFEEWWKLEQRELKPLHHLGVNVFSVLEGPMEVEP